MIGTSRQTYFLVKYFLVQTVKLHMCKVHVFMKCVAYELGSRQYDGTSYLDFSTFCIVAFSVLNLNIFVYLMEIRQKRKYWSYSKPFIIKIQHYNNPNKFIYRIFKMKNQLELFCITLFFQLCLYILEILPILSIKINETRYQMQSM